MKESQIEEKIRQYAESKNCLLKKFTSPGWVGAPDRILITPCGQVAFIEIKRMGGTVEPKQYRVCAMLNARNVPSAIVDSLDSAKGFIDVLLEYPSTTGFVDVSKF